MKVQKADLKYLNLKVVAGSVFLGLLITAVFFNAQSMAGFFQGEAERSMAMDAPLVQSPEKSGTDAWLESDDRAKASAVSAVHDTALTTAHSAAEYPIVECNQNALLRTKIN